MEESGHLERSTLVELTEGRLPRSRRLRAARHLKGCRRCREKLRRQLAQSDTSSGRRLRWPSGPPSDAEAYRRTFDGLSALLDDLQDDAAEQRAPYRKPAHPEPLGWLKDGTPFRHHGPLAVCKLLLESSLQALTRRPARARTLAQQAIELAGDQPSGNRWRAMLRDVQARGWAYLGYLHHREEERAAAEDAFERAEACLREGSCDPLEEAHVLQLAALWAEGCGRTEEAEWLLDREAQLYEGHSRLQGRAFVHKASLRARAGDLDRAIRLCRAGIALLDPEADQELAAIAHRDLLHYLCAAGDLDQARSLAASLAAAGRLPWAAAELRRVEGKIAWVWGRLDEAAAAYGEAQRCFVALGDLGEAARVTLDLAAVLCRDRRSTGPGYLELLIGPLLEVPALSPEIRAVLERLRQAAAGRELTPELVDELVGEVEEDDHAEAYLALT